jgi:hypothetical protein
VNADRPEGLGALAARGTDEAASTDGRTLLRLPSSRLKPGPPLP